MSLRRMKAKYAGRCAAGAECSHGGKVFPGNAIVWERETKMTWHDSGCDDVVMGNRFGEYEAEQERQAFQAKMDAEMAMGAAIADHVRTTRDLFGEQAAAAEELAWEMKLGDW